MSKTISGARALSLPGTADRPHYLPADLYQDLVAALFDRRFDPMDAANNAKIALGEIGNLWPLSIK